MRAAGRSAHHRGRRVVGTVVTGALSFALLAGCGSSSSSPGGGGSPGSTQATGKTLTIGLSSVLSGPASTYSQESDGAKVYFDMINAQGGVNGYKFKFAEKDNAYQPSQGVAIAHQFAQQKVFEIIEVGSPIFQATKPLAAQLGVPIIAGADGDLFTPAIHNLFGATPGYTGLAQFDMHFMLHNLHQKKVALAYENDDVGSPAAKADPAYVKANGGDLVASIPVDVTTTDFSAFANKLKSSGATAVDAFMATSTFAGLQKASNAIGYHPKWITFFTQATPSYTQLVGTMANGVYASTFLTTSGAAEHQYTQAVKQFEPALADGLLARQGFTFGAITVAGIRKATAGGKPLTPAGYLNALNSFANQPAGLLPSVTYNGNSHAGVVKVAMVHYVGTTPNQVTPFTVPPGVSASGS